MLLLQVEGIRDEIGISKYDIWSTTDAAALWPEPALRESAITPLFGCSTNSRGSQRISFMSSSSVETVASTVSPAESIDGCLFQEKADDAAVVILLLSKAFAASSVCKHFVSRAADLRDWATYSFFFRQVWRIRNCCYPNRAHPIFSPVQLRR